MAGPSNPFASIIWIRFNGSPALPRGTLSLPVFTVVGSPAIISLGGRQTCVKPPSLSDVARLAWVLPTVCPTSSAGASLFILKPE